MIDLILFIINLIDSNAILVEQVNVIGFIWLDPRAVEYWIHGCDTQRDNKLHV